MAFYPVYACGQTKKLALPKRLEESFINLNTDQECVICSEFLRQSVISLPCDRNHIFHSHCIEKWLILKPRCPICRSKVCPSGQRRSLGNVLIVTRESDVRRDESSSDEYSDEEEELN